MAAVPIQALWIILCETENACSKLPTNFQEVIGGLAKLGV
jgi:hypothetical protein